jgi:23S rRNA (cytosine1962-C5)-methyltransferase
VQRHPWLFSGAISGVRGRPAPGEAVDVLASSGEWLARGMWSGASQIRARLVTWQPDEPIDSRLLAGRIERALEARERLGLLAEGQACRLVYAESDGLPGLIVDRYGEYLVVQILTQGMAVRQQALVEILAERLRPRGIYERSDADMREREGLPPADGLLWGDPPPERLEFLQAGGLRGVVSLRAGQKTGAYLDQALNRLRVAAYCAGASVLDAFCYSGGFTAAAVRAGASHVTAADSSAAALALVQDTLALNRAGQPAQVDTIEADIFQLLRRYRAEERMFDVIILDPPKFAHSQGQVERATRGYKDINLNALRLIRPGGVLATFSCSGLVSADLFQKVLFGAALDARRDVQIIERLTQAPDHPVLLSFPEGEYLKGFICRVW